MKIIASTVLIETDLIAHARITPSHMPPVLRILFKGVDGELRLEGTLAMEVWDALKKAFENAPLRLPLHYVWETPTTPYVTPPYWTTTTGSAPGIKPVS